MCASASLSNPQAGGVFASLPSGGFDGALQVLGSHLFEFDEKLEPVVGALVEDFCIVGEAG